MSVITKVLRRINREVKMRPLMRKGYSRRTASTWFKRKRNDEKKYAALLSKNEIKELHNANFLCSTVERYGIENIENTDIITDFDYLSLRPFNNAFEKWLQEITYTNKMLRNHQDVCRTVYFTVMKRDEKSIILPLGGDDKEYGCRDIIDLVKEKGLVELRPAFWRRKHKRFRLEYDNNQEAFLVNGEQCLLEEFEEIVASLNAIYVIADYVSINHSFGEEEYESIINVWIANDAGPHTALLSAEIQRFCDIESTEEDEEEQNDVKQILDTSTVNISNGKYSFDGKEYSIPEWNRMVDKLIAIGNDLKQISYFTLSLSFEENGLFKIVSTSTNPNLPLSEINSELNEYLKKKLERKNQSLIPPEQRRASEINKLKTKAIKKLCRKGVRPYMQKIWHDAKRDDWANTKGPSPAKKLWAHRNGFLSYRLWQYNLNKSNYKEFLSDYDYLWLNRINNSFQRQINDKTSYRYVMEDFKEFLPEYYFSIIRRNDEVEFIRMPDCPPEIDSNIEGVLELLKRKGKLAFKASSGTHGDGFYCLAYENDKYFINDEVSSGDDIEELLLSIKSFYIITDFLHMHEELRKIYDKTVNTVRIMVINRHGYDPKIMQTYMRIGASKTGYTDNVGYGGICAMVDSDTGKIYDAETISKHVFYDCPTHPDTGEQINGVILPRWKEACDVVLKMSRNLCELEYLGYDVAITDNGIKVLEINIHQDLHKVADHTEEIREYYKDKIQQKRARHNI